MDLGITVDQVIEVKMGDYLNSLSPEERAQKKQEYIDAGRDAIQSDIDEAESLADSVKSTAQQVIESIPIWTTQISAIAAGVSNPVTSIPSITALATMKQNISATKDTVTRAFSQVKRIMGILTILGVTSAAVTAITNLLSSAQAGLESVPEIEVPEEPTEPEPEPEQEPEKAPNLHKYELKSGNISGMEISSDVEYYIFQSVELEDPDVREVHVTLPANPQDGEVHILKVDYTTTDPVTGFIIHANTDQYIASNGGLTMEYDLLIRGSYGHYIFVDSSKTWVKI